MICKRKKESRVIISFDSTCFAFEAEEFFGEREIPGRLIPLPGEIKSGCGMAWCSPVENKERVLSALEDSGVPYHGVDVLELYV